MTVGSRGTGTRMAAGQRGIGSSRSPGVVAALLPPLPPASRRTNAAEVRTSVTIVGVAIAFVASCASAAPAEPRWTRFVFLDSTIEIPPGWRLTWKPARRPTFWGYSLWPVRARPVHVVGVALHDKSKEETVRWLRETTMFIHDVETARNAQVSRHDTAEGTVYCVTGRGQHLVVACLRWPEAEQGTTAIAKFLGPGPEALERIGGIEMVVEIARRTRGFGYTDVPSPLGL